MWEWLKNPWAWGLPWTWCVNCGRRFWRSFPWFCFQEHCCHECAKEEYEWVDKIFREAGEHPSQKQ